MKLIIYKIKGIGFLLGISILLNSCLGVKFLKDNEKILVQQEIKGISGKLKNKAKEKLQQKPNTKMGLLFVKIPFTHLAHLYMLGKNGTLFINGYNPQKIADKRGAITYKIDNKIAMTDHAKKIKHLKNKKIRKIDNKNKKINQGNRLMRWGEPLAIYRETDKTQNVNHIKQLLFANGFFNAQITPIVKNYEKNNKLINLTFHIDPGPHFYIDSIEYLVQDTAIHALLQNNLKQMPLQKGYYHAQNLQNERNKVYEIITNHGYYNFSKKYIFFQIDSITLGNHKLILKEIIVNPPQQNQHKTYTIDSIIFKSDGGTRYPASFVNYDGINFFFGKQRYAKKILRRKIPIKKNTYYNQSHTLETRNQLLALDNFKFINIKYDSSDQHLVATISTTSVQKHQTSTEFGITGTQGLPGPFLNFSIKKRNLFKRFEIIELDLNMKLEDIGNISDELGKNILYASTKYGSEISITFPQFLFPGLAKLKNKFNLANPKSKLSIGFSIENRVNIYALNIYQGSYEYIWQIRGLNKYTFAPFQIGITNSKNNTAFQLLLDSLEQDGNTFSNSFRSALLTSTYFEVERNFYDYERGNKGSYIQWFIESGGHYNKIFHQTSIRNNLEYYQYLKTSIDWRRISRLLTNTKLAYRLKIGIAYAYADNNSLPYSKYFFAGGGSDIRAWQPRRLGPGAFGIFQQNQKQTNNYHKVTYFREQPGDILILSNIELRHDFTGILEGAIFLDAGNIWLLKSNTINPTEDNHNDDGIFRFNTFISEIAIGTGLGLRFDLTYLILRLDMGIKIYDPAQNKQNRLVVNKIFSHFNELSAFNIGIGYPF